MCERPCKRNQLLLPSGQARTALPHRLRKRQWQRPDKVTHVDLISRALHAFFRDAACAEADVVCDCPGKKKRILQDNAEALAKLFQILLPYVDTVDKDFTALNVVEPHHQCCNRCFASTCMPYDGRGFIRIDRESHATQNPLDRSILRGIVMWIVRYGDVLVREPDITELDAAVLRRVHNWNDGF